MTHNTTTDELIARFEAAFLPGWTWEVLEVEERDADVYICTDDNGEPVCEKTDVYYGRVRSPNTCDRWEYGTFTKRELWTAGGYRVDRNTGHWP